MEDPDEFAPPRRGRRRAEAVSPVFSASAAASCSRSPRSRPPALLLRLGQDDLLGKDGLGWDKVAAVLGAAGGSLFNWLPLLFAVGIAVGFARKGDGSTAVAAVVGFFVFTSVIQVFAPLKDLPGYKPNGGFELAPIKWPYSVLAGVVVGIVAAAAVAALPPHQAARLPGVLRRPPVRPDHHRLRAADPRRDLRPALQVRRTPASDRRRRGHRRPRRRWRHLRRCSTAC